MTTEAARRLSGRWSQFRRIVSAEGWGGATDRARRSLANRLLPAAPPISVRNSDIAAADLEKVVEQCPACRSPEGPLTLNWVTVPAGPRSGGHTTMYRIVNHLQSIGYRNRMYFYDVNHVDLTHYERIARTHYGFVGEVSSVDRGMQDAHGLVATSWPTAYPVFNARCAGKRFFFVQDYEPDFYPKGTCSVLAENTYRMGFHAITAGRWLAHKLRQEFGMQADAFDFGCDTSAYRHEGRIRNGIAYYARPEVARRGFELGVLALEILARRRPDIEIHFYGDRISRMPFRFTDHGRIAPAQLNALYNRCHAGLSLSLTNVSLVPHEMLASGCIPVVNDAQQNRMVLDNPYVQYARLEPHALASALQHVIERQDLEHFSRDAAGSVRENSWDDAGATVDMIFRRAFGMEGTAMPTPRVQPSQI